MFILNVLYSFTCYALCDIYLYFLVQLEGTCFGIIINTSSFPLFIRISLLCTTLWSNRPNLERIFCRWTLFGVHVCVIDGQSARGLQSVALFSLWQGCVVHKNFAYRVGGWGGINRFWWIILNQEIKIVRIQSISVNVLHMHVNTVRLGIYEIWQQREHVAMTVNLLVVTWDGIASCINRSVVGKIIDCSFQAYFMRLLIYLEWKFKIAL